MTKTSRLHSLDSLRAIMMLLGLVLHSSESYNIGDNDIWPRDPMSTHIFLNYLNSLIHVFRMPVFFMVAGFFGALLFYERGSKPMITNRMKRITLPFMVFLLVLHPIIILAFDFTSNAFNAPLSDISTELSLFPQITYHLWFLYYLILLTLFSFGLALLLNKAPGFRQKINFSFRWLMDRKLVAILVFGIMLFIVMLYIWDYSVPTPLSFIPDAGDFLFFLLFYLMGWVLYTSKYPLNSLMKNDWLFTSIAVIAFTLRFAWSSHIDDVLIAIIHALITWMFVFGITGLFIRYTSQYSSRMRYISDSSYWVFLVHLPLTAFMPGLMAGWMLPAIIKFLITLTGTAAICLVTYHYWVRSTGIGQFLNGRKYS
ncbi:MAG: acyltransferase family protein [Cyclobacteriaceae bacterium]